MIIEHRLIRIINSDKIIFLNDGKTETEGAHEELMKNNDMFRKLYEKEIMEY